MAAVWYALDASRQSLSRGISATHRNGSHCRSSKHPILRHAVEEQPLSIAVSRGSMPANRCPSFQEAGSRSTCDLTTRQGIAVAGRE
jgi:hypothetical protein